jgi:hypothetical protein
MRAASHPWNNSATANPSTNTGGQALTGLTAGPYYALFQAQAPSDAATVNFGASAFSQAVPTGFAAWDSAGALIGTAAIVSDATGTLTNSPGIAGTTAIVAASFATLTGQGALAATSQAFATASGTTTGQGALTGAAAIASGAFGSLANLVFGTLVGGAAIASSASGTLAGGGVFTSLLDVDATIISQYANSPALLSLIQSFSAWINPDVNITAFYRLIWDVDTAQGVGLDIWGRIVGVQRTLNVAPGKYFGFDEATNVSADPYDQSPFWSGGTTTSNFSLSDAAFRLLIFAKALLNITDGSIPSINQILLTLFPGRGNCYVTDGEDMTMSYTFSGFSPPLQLFEVAIVQQANVLPKPVGVAATVIQA